MSWECHWLTVFHPCCLYSIGWKVTWKSCVVRGVEAALARGTDETTENVHLPDQCSKNPGPHEYKAELLSSL